MSSSEQDRVRELAERVARKLSGEPTGGGARAAGEGEELASLRASLVEIQRRLDKIEAHTTRDSGARAQDNDAPRQPNAAEAGRSPASSPQNLAQPARTPTRSMWLSGTYVPATEHPSREQFTGIGEAVSELVEFFER